MSTEKFNEIKSEIFIMIYDNNDNFAEELYFFKNLANNIDNKSYNKAIAIIENLMEKYKNKNAIHQLKLLKMKTLPFIYGIPNSIRFRNNDSYMYANVSDFEQKYYEFINRLIKEQKIYKNCYKFSNKTIRDCKDLNDLYNVYITLKSVIALQLQMDENIEYFELQITNFSNSYEYQAFKPNGFNLDELSLYFSVINKEDEKKVKYLHY